MLQGGRTFSVCFFAVTRANRGVGSNAPKPALPKASPKGLRKVESRLWVNRRVAGRYSRNAMLSCLLVGICDFDQDRFRPWPPNKL